MEGVLTAAALRAWARVALERLGRERARIDALNVFPVPDGDTGTNCYLTFEAAVRALDRAGGQDDTGTLARLMARAALLGARGNSGVILSQQLRGLGHAGIPAGVPVDAPVLAAAMTAMAQAGYAAVHEPREGTMLTVARDAAAAATAAAAAGADLAGVAVAAADEAAAALARTPHQLEVLRLAGVVDSGGAAIVVLLDALAEVATGLSRGDLVLPVPDLVPPPAGPVDSTRYVGPAFEVMYLLDAADDDVPRLRTHLADLGDSLVVVGGDGLWNVHVHADDAGAAIEAALAIGRPHRIRVTALEESDVVRERVFGALQRRAVVVACLGSGTVDLVRDSGAHPVVPAHGSRPSVEELIAGIHSAGAREVVVLPGDSDAIPAAEAAARHARAEGLRVAVVPTRSIVQSLSALAMHEESQDFDTAVITMTRVAGATRYAGVTVAVRDGVTSAGRCRPGDVLGVVAGEIVEIGDDVAAVAQRLLARMLVTDAELVTLITGSDVQDGALDGVRRWLDDEHSTVEVVTHDGRQPSWPLLLGVE